MPGKPQSAEVKTRGRVAALQPGESIKEKQVSKKLLFLEIFLKAF